MRNDAIAHCSGLHAKRVNLQAIEHSEQRIVLAMQEQIISQPEIAGHRGELRRVATPAGRRVDDDVGARRKVASGAECAAVGRDCNS